MINEAIDRIRQMEMHFDVLQEAAKQNPASIRKDAALREHLRILMQYYDGGQWLRDYESDERGELPCGLKRGVLSQDGVYDLLSSLTNPEEK